MLWISFCFATAVLAGSSDAIAKHALRTSRMPTVALARYGWAAAILLPLTIAGFHIPDPRTFWTAIATAFPLEIVAALLYQTALRASPLSLTVPYLAFSPVFLLATGWILLGEVPTGAGVLGVMLVTAGALILQHPNRVGEPWYRWIVPAERGSRLMIGVAFIYSITAVLAKRAVLASSPLTFPGIYFGLLAIGLIPFQWRSPTWIREAVARPRIFGAMGLLEAAILILQFYAIAHVEVAYAVSIKRLSLLFAVLYGRLFFQEEWSTARFTGAAVMVAGAVIIAINR